MEDAWDKRYVISVGKGLLVDIILVIIFTILFVCYNLIFNNAVVFPITILTNQYFLINNFILLLCLITYFIYKSREIF